MIVGARSDSPAATTRTCVHEVVAADVLESSWSNVVSMSTRQSVCAQTARAASMPSRFGMRMSRRATSG
jgi:hypothetical protein